MHSSLAGIARFPRVRLGHTPTPLDPVPNLGAALGIDLWSTGCWLGMAAARQFRGGRRRCRPASLPIAGRTR